MTPTHAHPYHRADFPAFFRIGAIVKTSPPALAALAAALLAGCAHGDAATERELARLREQVARLQQVRDQDRLRLEALEAQLAALARRQQEEKKAPAPAAPQHPHSTVRLAPPPAPPAPSIEEEEDSFIFIVDRGDGDEAPTSRPSRHARRGLPAGGGPGVDKAPPLPTAIELREPASLASGPARPQGPDAYDDGIAALHAGDAAAAVFHLERFLAAAPRDRRADNAGLALGEAYARQQQPGRALQAWERVATDYPAGDAVPDALLRYGETCRTLGRDAAARAAFERLVRDYPGTEAATRAGAWLAEGK